MRSRNPSVFPLLGLGRSADGGLLRALESLLSPAGVGAAATADAVAALVAALEDILGEGVLRNGDSGPAVEGVDLPLVIAMPGLGVFSTTESGVRDIAAPWDAATGEAAGWLLGVLGVFCPEAGAIGCRGLEDGGRNGGRCCGFCAGAQFWASAMAWGRAPCLTL